MAPNVLRRTPTDAELLDRTGIITASLPVQRQADTALDDPPGCAGPRGVHRSGFASMAVTVLMLIVAVGAVVNRELPAPSGVAVDQQQRPTVMSAPPASPAVPTSTPTAESRRAATTAQPKPQPKPQPRPIPQPTPVEQQPTRQVAEQSREPVDIPEPDPSRPKLEPEPDVRADRSFTERVRDLIGPAIERYERERREFRDRHEHGDLSDLRTYAQRWQELLSADDW